MAAGMLSVQVTTANGRTVRLLFVDSEGLDAVRASQQSDVHLFSLAVLISSLVIFNSSGAIDEASIKKLSLIAQVRAGRCGIRRRLECTVRSRRTPVAQGMAPTTCTEGERPLTSAGLLTENPGVRARLPLTEFACWPSGCACWPQLSKNIHINGNGQGDSPEDFENVFPYFLWVLRDFTLALTSADGSELSPSEYLEQALRRWVRRHARPCRARCRSLELSRRRRRRRR